MRCGDGTYYCGVTKDIIARVAKHNEGRGAKYTRGRWPIRLVINSEALTKSEALKREHHVKKQKKRNKIKAVRGDE